MKKLAYLLPIILLAAACTKEPDAVVGPETHKVPLNITIETKAGGSGEDGDGLEVNSVRVAVFKKLGGAASSDLMVLNEFYPFGFDVDDANRADKDTVTVRPVLELDLNCDNYYVYVVLNEEGYTLKGGAVLSSSLEDLVNRGEMDDLLATPAIYPGAGVKEAPFCLMSACKEVSFGADKDRPVDVKFNAADNKAVRRNMAQITVGSIKSDISDPSADRTFEAELPKIFVLSVDLVNVPSDMTWSDAEGGITGGTRSIQIGTKNAQGYYDRVWHGSVYQDVNVTVTKREETDAKYYRSQWGWDFKGHQDKNIDKKGWSFDASSAAVFNDPGIPNNKDFKKVYASAKTHRKAIDDSYAANNSVGKLISDLNTLYNSGDHDFEENLKTIITATGYASGTPSSAYCSNETWSVSLDDSYYVPENISSSAGSATCIKVRLAVASPSIDLTGVAASALPAPGTITGTGTSSYYLDNTYYKKDGSFNVQSFDLATKLSGDIYTTAYGKKGAYNDPSHVPAKMTVLFEKLGHIVNADDEMIEYTTTGDDLTNNYKVYIDGFYRLTKGLTGRTTVNQDQPGATFSWGIPTSGTNVKEFYIPVNNNLDGTYDIKRNTRYTVNLTVTKNTYEAATKASGSGDEFGFGISAEVTTERLTENED